MKKTLLFAITAIMMLSLAAVAFTYTRTTSNDAAKMSCCGDSCPMKDKKNAAGDKMSCCGDSCPMKDKKNAAGEKMACDCCDGDSCPMMNGKHADHTAMSGHGDSC